MTEGVAHTKTNSHLLSLITAASLVGVMGKMNPTGMCQCGWEVMYHCALSIMCQTIQGIVHHVYKT